MTRPIRPLRQDVHAVVLVPSDAEWQALRRSYEGLRPGIALGREFLSRSFGRRRVVFVQTGEDQIEAAISAQYAVDRWSPRLLATDTDNEPFAHVASRNRLALVPVIQLGLPPAVLDDTSTSIAVSHDELITNDDDVFVAEDEAMTTEDSEDQYRTR